MRNVLNSINMLRFQFLNYNYQHTKSYHNYPNVSRYKVQLYPNYQADFITALPKKSSSNCQACQRGDKRIKIKEIKNGMGKLTLYLEEKCVYIS